MRAGAVWRRTPASEDGQAGAARILLLGGSGVLGSHLARMLAGLPRTEVILAGRDAGRLGDTARSLAASGLFAGEFPVPDLAATFALDRAAGDLALDNLLQAVRPALVINAAGPFTDAFSVWSTAVAAACIRHRVAYVDVSESRSHIAALRRLDAAALAAGVPVITGAGLLPSVSMAAAIAISRDLNVITGVRVYVCPSNQEPRGPATQNAMLAAAGQRFRLLRGGVWRRAFAWQGLSHIDLPGVTTDSSPVRRLFALRDAPDYDLLAERWPGLRDARVMAGLELGSLQRGLWLAAWAPRLGLVRDLVWAQAIATDLVGLFRHFGSGRSALRVELEGVAGTHAVRRLWQLEGDDGDLIWIAAAPAAALARLILIRPGPLAGARAAAGIPSLHEIVAELRHRDIRVRTLDLDV